MVILMVLMLLVPALISVLLYERFKGYEMIKQKKVILYVILAFLINMACYVVLWVRGWEYQTWSLDIHSELTRVSFVLKYMGSSLVAAVGFAYLLSLLEVGKSGIKLVMGRKKEFIVAGIILAALITFFAFNLFGD